MGRDIVIDKNDSVLAEEQVSLTKIANPPKDKIRTTRTVSSSVRVRVLDRDNFRCVFCGRSPATDIGIRLDIDHIVSFSKGGKTMIDNLQTLCQDCNLGKSDGRIGF